MLHTLTAEQRQAIAQEGVPLSLVDADSGQAYLLLAIHFSPGMDGSVIASIPGLRLFGEADAPDEAAISLAEATRLLIGD